MTKKDYEAIAAIIREFQDVNRTVRAQLATQVSERLAEYMAADNPRFDRARFLAACRGEDATDSAGRKVRYSVKRDKVEIPTTDEQLAR